MAARRGADLPQRSEGAKGSGESKGKQGMDQRPKQLGGTQRRGGSQRAQRGASSNLRNWHEAEGSDDGVVEGGADGVNLGVVAGGMDAVGEQDDEEFALGVEPE